MPIVNNNSWRMKRYLLTDDTPVAVIAPIDCNFVGIRNAGAVLVKLISDTNDANAYDELAPGVQEIIGVSKIVSYTNQPFSTLTAPPRFPAKTTLCYLQGNGADMRFHFVL